MSLEVQGTRAAVALVRSSWTSPPARAWRQWWRAYCA